jgi:VWFA-related protein
VARIARWIHLWSLALIVCGQPILLPLSASQHTQYRLAVDVDLVNVTVTVLDESGVYLQDLKVDDFQILEDGREQEISFFSQDQRSPISIGVVIVNSESQQDKLQQALQTVREIATTLSGDDEMFIITFNSVAQIRQKFTSDPQQILRSLENIKSNGETAVHDAIALGLREIRTASNQKKILLLITDGFDTKSKITAVETEQLLRESEVLAYAIGIDNNPHVRKRVRYATYYYMLNKWTAAAGGRVIRLVAGQSYAARNIAQLLLEELRQQYTISYYPTASPENPGWRNIELRLSRPGARMRYRTGYFAAAQGDASSENAANKDGAGRRRHLRKKP